MLMYIWYRTLWYFPYGWLSLSPKWDLNTTSLLLNCKKGRQVVNVHIHIFWIAFFRPFCLCLPSVSRYGGFACLSVCRVCFGWSLRYFKGHDGGLAAPDVPHLFSVPFLNPTGFKLEPVCLKISQLVLWLFPVLLHVCVCGFGLI